MRIERLRIHGLGPFDDEEFVFPSGSDPLRADSHLFVGVNGTGKTTALRALASVFDASAAEGLSLRATTDDWSVRVQTSDGWIHCTSRGAQFDVDSMASAVLGSYPDTMVSASTELAGAPFLASSQRGGLGKTPFAAISHGSFRSARSRGVRAGGSFQIDPLKSWHNGSTNHPQLVAKWLADVQLKATAASRKGHTKAADRFERSIHAIASLLRTILERDVELAVDHDDLEARLVLDGVELPFDFLPDGVRAALAWIADTYMRLEEIDWTTEARPEEREFALLIDEIDAHLHPKWQRRILFAFESLFPNAQVFASTHSPFVINSLTDAHVHPITLEGAKARVQPAVPADPGDSIREVLEEILGVEEEFGPSVESAYKELLQLRDRVLQGEVSAHGDFDDLADRLARHGGKLQMLVEHTRRAAERRISKGA